MKTLDIANRLALGLVNNTYDYSVIAAGPLTRQPGTMPYRVVLTARDSQFTVHREYFDIEVDKIGRASCRERV